MTSRTRFGGDTITVVSMLIQQTGTFHNVYNRPFRTNFDDDTIESVRQRIAGSGRGARLTSNNFNGISSRILAPVAEVNPTRDLIEISDGWDRPRCRFMMQLEVDTRLGGKDTYYVQGFSEYLGLSVKGNIDTDMKWFINGFIRVQFMERDTRRGTETYGVVKESAQIINGALVYDKDIAVETTRTVDIFGRLQEDFYSAGYSESADDDRGILTSPVDSIFAARKDNLSGNYLSSTLNTWRRNLDTNAFGSGREDILSRAQQELNAELISMEDMPFLRQLAHIQQRPSTTSFTIKDLLDIDPEADRAIEGGELDTRAAKQLAHNGETVSDWRGADMECIWATQISNSVSAILMTNYHTGFHGTISNLNIDRRPVLEVSDNIAVAKGLPREIFERMCEQIENFLDDLSNSGRIGFTVEIKASLYDQTELFISIDGAEEQRFFVPSFADSLMSPFYSRDKTIMTDISTDMSELLEEVNGEMSGSIFSAVR